MKHVKVSTAILGAMLLWPPPAAADQDAAAARILLDQPPRAIEYQLRRLSNEQLLGVERKDDDVKYRLVYYALLTRQGLAREFRDEALAALTKIDQASPTRVLLEALARVPAEDGLTAERLSGILLGQPAATLRGQREVLAQAIAAAVSPMVLRAAYAGVIIAEGHPGGAWQMAVKHEGHLVELLRGVPLLSAAAGGADELRASLFEPIAALLGETRDSGTRAAAIAALGWTRRDAETFNLLAQEVQNPKAGSDETRAAALASLQLIPERVWPAGEIDPLARAIVALVKATPPDRRTESRIIEAIQLGERLAAALPRESGVGVRRELRALGVHVVRIDTVVEQMRFDLAWFVAEAGKPVQIILNNPDPMPHNLVVTKPGSLQEIGKAATTMPMPSDPEVKPYVPDSPLVLYATGLLKEGETEPLSFTAPTDPGEYVYLCTVPGHWVRMYGVMLVVPNLEAWEAQPTTPTDPMTGKPFASRRTQ